MIPDLNVQFGRYRSNVGLPSVNGRRCRHVTVTFLQPFNGTFCGRYLWKFPHGYRVQFTLVAATHVRCSLDLNGVRDKCHDIVIVCPGANQQVLFTCLNLMETATSTQHPAAGEIREIITIIILLSVSPFLYFNDL